MNMVHLLFHGRARFGWDVSEHSAAQQSWLDKRMS